MATQNFGTAALFTNTTLPIKHLVPDWIQRLREDCDKEDCDYEDWPVLMVPESTRVCVWSTCQMLGAASLGVPGRACRMLEQYLAAAWRATDAAVVQHERAPLLLAACVMLAAKMNCSGAMLTASAVRESLVRGGLTYSLEEVIAAEHEVFRVLGYRVPLWWSTEAAEALATWSGVAGAARRALPLCVELAEYYRARLSRAAAAAAGAPGTLRTLHLAAAAVRVAARLVRAPDPLPRLLLATAAPPRLLACLSDLLLALLLDNGEHSDTSDDTTENYF